MEQVLVNLALVGGAFAVFVGVMFVWGWLSESTSIRRAQSNDEAGL